MRALITPNGAIVRSRYARTAVARIARATRMNRDPDEPRRDPDEAWCCPNRELVASRREARRGFGEPIPPRRLLVRPGDTGSRCGQRLFIGDASAELNGHPWHATGGTRCAQPRHCA